MRINAALCLTSLLLLPLSARSQEGSWGVSVPVTLSGSAEYSRTSESGEAIYRDKSAGFRSVLSPSLQLGPHWFAYSAFDVRSSSYLAYGSGAASEDIVHFTLMQAYLGYKADFKDGSLLLKAGRLASAFGLYPLEYDDAKTPLIGVPLVYAANLPLRPDQLPCGVSDIVSFSAEDKLQFTCGGASTPRYGLLPVALFGIPGVEAQVSWNRLDARLQIANSSPANPQSILSGSQFLQWTAGAGYSIPGGLRVGASAYHGPYLDSIVAPYLPAGRRLHDFPASAIGLDATWLRGPWSAEGEWQRFHFALPGFSQSPSEQAAYLQVKLILSPRLFVAARTAFESPGPATGLSGQTTDRIAYGQTKQELVFGVRVHRLELIKAGLHYTKRPSWSLDNGLWNAQHGIGFEVQCVTSWSAVSRAFR